MFADHPVMPARSQPAVQRPLRPRPRAAVRESDEVGAEHRSAASRRPRVRVPQALEAHRPPLERAIRHTRPVLEAEDDRGVEHRERPRRHRDAGDPRAVDRVDHAAGHGDVVTRAWTAIGRHRGTGSAGRRVVQPPPPRGRGVDERGVRAQRQQGRDGAGSRRLVVLGHLVHPRAGREPRLRRDLAGHRLARVARSSRLVETEHPVLAADQSAERDELRVGAHVPFDAAARAPDPSRIRARSGIVERTLRSAERSLHDRRSCCYAGSTTRPSSAGAARRSWRGRTRTV